MNKHKNIVDSIAIDMRNSCDASSNLNDFVPDEIIIAKLSNIEELEQTDRDGRTLLINAAFCGRERCVIYLVNRGADVNAKDRDGFTALHAAVQENCLEIIKILLENGADIHAKDAWGNEPLARENKNTSNEIFKILMEYGADPNARNYYGGYSVMELCWDRPDVLAILRKGKES